MKIGIHKILQNCYLIWSMTIFSRLFKGYICTFLLLCNINKHILNEIYIYFLSDSISLAYMYYDKIMRIIKIPLNSADFDQWMPGPSSSLSEYREDKKPWDRGCNIWLHPIIFIIFNSSVDLGNCISHLKIHLQGFMMNNQILLWH